MWNLKNKTHEHGGRGERGKPENSLLIIKKLRVAGGDVGGGDGLNG